MATKFLASVVPIMEEVIKNTRPSDDVTNFIKLNSKHIQLLNTSMKTEVNINAKKSIQAALGKMIGYRTFLKVMAVRKAGPARVQSDRIRWHDIRATFDARVRTGCIVNLKHKDPLAFIEDCESMIVRRIRNALRKDASLKVNTIFCGKFTKSEEEEFKHITTKNAKIGINDDLIRWYKDYIRTPILEGLECQLQNSGWSLSAVVNLCVNINKYNPVRVGSIHRFQRRKKRSLYK